MSERDETHIREPAETVPETDAEPEPASLLRHEEELLVGKEAYDAGAVHVHKTVETQHVAQDFGRDVEYADVERVEPGAHDSGKVETLPDGSVSVPILEEELVVTKRTVVRERIIIRKRTVTETHRVEADLLRERVAVDSDPTVEVEDDGDEPRATPERA